MAKVVAAVDLARVRQPVHGEGGRAEEEVEAVEVELRQQADKQYGDSWTTGRAQAGQMLTTAQEFTLEPTLLLPQVREASSKQTATLSRDLTK